MPAARRNSHFRRACALAALLALTLLQVSWAGHQFQHQGGEMLEVCGICMQLDRVDQFLSPVEHLLLDEPIVFAYCTELQPSVPSADPLAYETRAPPTV
ncbi:MAG TPA: hypothetical protein VLB07_10265 [Woeseiaceae bacterium]|nr:hypothetical protein [Woeseiaceae bacterium]